jgi:hypothetical protein
VPSSPKEDFISKVLYLCHSERSGESLLSSPEMDSSSFRSLERLLIQDPSKGRRKKKEERLRLSSILQRGCSVDKVIPLIHGQVAPACYAILIKKVFTDFSQ